jgi:hypothetical protein
MSTADAGTAGCGVGDGVSMPNTKMPAARLGINNFQVGKYVLFARIENPDVYQCQRFASKYFASANPLPMTKYFCGV